MRERRAMDLELRPVYKDIDQRLGNRKFFNEITVNVVVDDESVFGLASGCATGMGD